MTHHSENPDPIASAGQIDDPDQPTTIEGHDDSRAGRDTQPDENAAEGDPEQPGGFRRTTASSGTTRTAVNAVDHGAGSHSAMSEDQGTAPEGKAPKVLQETGVPRVPEDTLDQQGAREVDSEALAATRKFQPRPGDENPNLPASAPGAPQEPGDAHSADSAQYEHPEEVPDIEPVRHSRVVEERVQEQERDFDLRTTEDGERYLTPTDLPPN